MNKIDYEHAGLEFVVGDKFIGAIGLPMFVESFAWRTNTGVEPEFRGLIDWERDDGDIFTGVEIVDLCWASNIARWRPHLPSIQTETPEEKAALDSLSSKLEDVGVMFDCELNDGVITAKVKSPYDVDAHVSDEIKPVYTQAMCDAGELPPVGAECIATAARGLETGLISWERGIVAYRSDIHTIFKVGVVEYVFATLLGRMLNSNQSKMSVKSR